MDGRYHYYKMNEHFQEEMKTLHILSIKQRR
jgi:hypothetical protein